MRSIKLYTLILVAVLGLNTRCKKLGLCEDDNLTLIRKKKSGDELRIDGYYYEGMTSTSEKYTTIAFLYQNGVSLGSSGYDAITASSGDIDVDQINSALKSKSAWGVYNISGDIIEFERWGASINGCFKTVYQKGEIKNDSMFVITRREYRDGGKVESVETPNSTFHFRPLETKPDSTNTFIK